MLSGTIPLNLGKVTKAKTFVARPDCADPIFLLKRLEYLEPLKVLSDRKRTSATRLNRNSKIIKTILKAIHDKKGEHVVSLDLRKINEAVADYFIICEAGSQPQVRAIADHIEEEVRVQCKDTPYHQEGRQQLQWVLLDYVDVVVHIMTPETRKFYKLEEMWSDAAAEDHNDA